MSDLNLENIVGFKAVDKNGNERQVTVDEMTELVSARIVSAASEISTFAAAAAAGTDEFEDQLPQSDTFSWLRTLDGSKNPTLTSSSAAAKVLGGLLPVVSIKNNGVYPMGTQIIDNSNGSFFAMKIIINRSSENGWLCIDVTTMGDTFFSKAVLYVGKNIVRHVVYAEKGGNPNRACYYDINNNTITIIYKPGDYGSFTRLNVTSLYDRSDTIAAEFISKMPDLNGFTKIETN
ncbi:hypothetical protein GAY01_15575 [Phocaeicola vulgatus]|uniref:Uncharacterized protein n=2 Tax=Phocaeicola TaxID=909656 RepID=A0A7J5FDI4_PHOVU|nr:hypothetical protein GAY01_15575 [Phocaeicola vulgatus]